MRTSMFLTLNWCLASVYVSLALTWQQTNSSQLTRDRSRSIEDEPPAWGRKHVCIDHRTKAYPCYVHGWSWWVYNVQPARKDAGSKPPQDCQKTKCYTTAVPHCKTQTVFQLTWCFRKTFLLTHKLGTACAVEMTAERHEWSELPMGATTATRIRSGTSVIRRSSIPPRAWVGPTTNWSQSDTVAKSKAATTWLLVVVEPNHSWWWPFRSPTNRNEARTSSACTAALDVSSMLWRESFNYILVKILGAMFKLIINSFNSWSR